jgi:predicted transcriptional regulator
MARHPSKHPTDVELEILHVLWDSGPSSLGQICQAVNERRPFAKTTVATVLTVMLDKQLVKRSRGSRGYLWAARVSRQATTDSLVGKLLDRVFDGSAQRLVAHLLEATRLTDQEREEIKGLLDSQPKQR